MSSPQDESSAYLDATLTNSNGGVSSDRSELSSEATPRISSPALTSSSPYALRSEPIPFSYRRSSSVNCSSATPHIAMLFSAPLVGEDFASQDGSRTGARDSAASPSPAVVQNLTSLPLLDFEREKMLLKKSVNEANVKVRISSTPATVDALRTLLTLGVQALHYCGHGHPAFIPFENGRGGVHALNHSKLSKLLLAGGALQASGLKLVFVNSCFSANAGQTFADAGVAHVVCCGGGAEEKSFLADEAAIQFMRAFYLAVVSGKTVRAAFDIGKASVLTAELHHDVDNFEQADLFTLLPKDGNHDVRIFFDSERGGCHDITHRTCKENLPTTPQTFCGRQFELYSVIDRVINNRLVTLTGGFGMGKSTLAISAAHYLSLRGFFSAVCHVQVQSAVSLWKDVVDNLKKLVMIPQEEGEDANSDNEDTFDELGGAFMGSMGARLGGDRVVDLEFLHRIKDVNVLLVLDGSEKLIDSGALKQFRSLLKILLTHTNRTKIILTTSKNSVGRLTFVNESVLEMQPLTKVEIAKMLMMKAPILRKGFTNSEEFINVISQHSALDFFNGNPYAVGLCCTLLQRLPVHERDLDNCLARFKMNKKHNKSLTAEGGTSPVVGAEPRDAIRGGDVDDSAAYMTSINDDIEISLLVDDIVNIKGEDDSSEDTDSNSDESEGMLARFRAESSHSNCCAFGGSCACIARPLLQRQASGGEGGGRGGCNPPVELLGKKRQSFPRTLQKRHSSIPDATNFQKQLIQGQQRADRSSFPNGLWGGAFSLSAAFPPERNNTPSLATPSDVGFDSVSEVGGYTAQRSTGLQESLHDEIGNDLQSFGLFKSWKLAAIGAALWCLSAFANSAREGGLLVSKELASLLVNLLQISHLLFDCLLVVGVYILFYYVETHLRLKRKKGE